MATAFLIGVLVALPQLLPAVELSRVSSRAGGGQPYGAYIATALPLRNLVTLLEPDFFGHPNPTSTPYWNAPRSNYAEWALYVGVAPFFMAAFALGLPWKRRSDALTTQGARPLPLERAFFAGTALLSLLIALGTPVAALLFYGVPGFRATGSPGRIVIVFALSVCILAAIGLENLLRADLPRATKERATLVAIFVPLLVVAFGASQAAQYQSAELPGTTLAGLLEPVHLSLLFGLGIAVVAGAAIFVASRSSKPSRAIGAFLVAIAASDLLVRGFGYNPSAPRDQVYPETPGIAFLRQKARADDLIAPIQSNWSMVKEQPPLRAVLPPNALTVYGLHDIGGYDSLLPGADKEQVKTAGDGLDPSPPENGNIVFIKRPETAVALGARYLVFAPDSAAAQRAAGTLRVVYSGDDLIILENPSPRYFDASVERAYQPTSFRVGLFGGLIALAVFSAAGAATIISLRRRADGFHRG